MLEGEEGDLWYGGENAPEGKLGTERGNYGRGVLARVVRGVRDSRENLCQRISRAMQLIKIYLIIP